MQLRRFAGFGLVASGIGLVAIGYVAAQSKAVIWPAQAIKWTDTAAAPGAKVAVLWGDPAKGPYGALKQVPAGTVLAAHTHKLESRVIMIRGTINFEIDGKTTTLGPGSYGQIPGGAPHAATCSKAGPCEYFETMNGAFDSTPVKK
jgi:hypothetical protein